MYLSLVFSSICLLAALLLLRRYGFLRYSLPLLAKKSYNPPPAVPGLPLIGNLLQLTEKKPHQTFARWAALYGPIYSIRTGASSVVVLNSAVLAKEAMVTRFSSISTRKLSNAVMQLTSNKALVATSDYGDYHRMTKRFIHEGILGSNAQKRFRPHRDTLIANVLEYLQAQITEDPLRAVNLREGFQMELFRLALKEAVGRNVESILVDELGREVSEEEMFQILVVDPMVGAIDVDWRDFFPYLKWVPNKSLENRINLIVERKMAVTRALIKEQRKNTASSEEGAGCYLDFLLSRGKDLTEEQLTSLIWEVIIEASDTTMVAVEWAMYELAGNKEIQEKLYEEIKSICGADKLSEEHLPRLPLLCAVFHETLRRYSPAPIIPLRYVHEDIKLGGYDIPSGTEIAINIYGCNLDPKEWDKPEKWDPSRFYKKDSDSMDLHKTMAFGAGKRVCSGSMQAMMITCSSIGRFIQEFQWSLKEGQGNDVDTVKLSSMKLQPLEAHIIPRCPVT
ncbi:GA requiring 3 [Wolffia australiana]